MRFLKKNWSWIISTGIVTFFMLIFFIIKKIEPFGNGSFVTYDTLSSYYPHLFYYKEKLSHLDNLFYDWSLGMGLPFQYRSLFFPPINAFVVFVNDNNIGAFVNFAFLSKIVFSTTAFGIYMSKRKVGRDNELYYIPLSLAYGLSAFILGYYHEIIWFDSYAVFPIILYGYELLKNETKPAVFILSLVYACLCCEYFTIFIAIFLILNFIFDEYESVKDFGRKLIGFSVSSLIAVGISAIGLFPFLFSVTGSGAGGEEVVSHRWFGNIFNILRYQFIFSKPIDLSYREDAANLYCGTFAVALFFVYLFVKEIPLKVRIKRLIFILCLVVTMDESVMNFIINGFHTPRGLPNRFSFMIIMLLLITVSDVLSCGASYKRIGIGFVVAVIYPILAYFFVDFDSIISSHATLISTLTITIIYGAVYCVANFKNDKRIINILSIIMILEIFVNSFFALSYEMSDISHIKAQITPLIGAVKQVKENESEAFYRSKAIGTGFSNAGTIMRIKSVTGFDNLINSDIKVFLNDLGYPITDVAILDYGGYEPLDSILGVRYFYSYEDNTFADSRYERVLDNDKVSVYRNENAFPLGFAVNKEIRSLGLEKYEVFGNVNNLSEKISSVNGVLEEIIPEYTFSGGGYTAEYGDVDYLYMKLNPLEGYQDPYIQSSFDVEEEGEYNLYVDFSNYGAILIKVNGENRRYVDIQSASVLRLGALAKGDHVDILVGNNPDVVEGLDYSSEQFLEMRLAKINEEKFQKLIDSVKSGQMRIKSMTDDHIEAEADLGKDQMLFTSIPYDSGWHVYDNGVEIKKEKVANAFIALDLGEGNHKITFKYVPDYLLLSVLISVIGIILFVIFIIWCRKHRNNIDDAESEVTEENRI